MEKSTRMYMLKQTWRGRGRLVEYQVSVSRRKKNGTVLTSMWKEELGEMEFTLEVRQYFKNSVFYLDAQFWILSEKSYFL